MIDISPYAAVIAILSTTCQSIREESCSKEQDMAVGELLRCNFPIGPVLLLILLLEMLCHEGLIGCASKAL